MSEPITIGPVWLHRGYHKMPLQGDLTLGEDGLRFDHFKSVNRWTWWYLLFPPAFGVMIYFLVKMELGGGRPHGDQAFIDEYTLWIALGAFVFGVLMIIIIAAITLTSGPRVSEPWSCRPEELMGHAINHSPPTPRWSMRRIIFGYRAHRSYSKTALTIQTISGTINFRWDGVLVQGNLPEFLARLEKRSRLLR